MSSRFVSGKSLKPTKVVLYGPEGVGKTTLASLFPKPLFVDGEGGTGRMDVVRYAERPTSWAHLRQIVGNILADPEDRETLVLDTADWLDDLAVQQVCAELNISTMGTTRKGDKDTSWGASYHRLEAVWADFLTQLEADFIDAGRMHICFLAHSTTKKFELPEEAGQFDRYELAMDKRSSAKLKQWSDMLLFLNYQTMVNIVQEAKGNQAAKARAQGGSRHVIQTEHSAAWDAKNRDNLPAQIFFDDKATLPAALLPTFCPITRGVSAPKPVQAIQKPATTVAPTAPMPAPTATTETELPTEKHIALKKLIELSGVTYEEVFEVVRVQKAGAIYPPGTPISALDKRLIEGLIFPHWEKIVERVNSNRNGKGVAA